MKIINSQRYPIESITHRRPLPAAQGALEFFINPPPDCIRVALVP